jgi:hypothetical protein
VFGALDSTPLDYPHEAGDDESKVKDSRELRKRLTMRKRGTALPSTKRGSKVGSEFE